MSGVYWACLIRCPHFPNFNPGLVFDAQDFHLPLSDYLLIFTSVFHPSSPLEDHYLVVVWGLAYIHDQESSTDGGAKLLVGSPILGWSKGRGQTKSDPLALQVGGGGHWTNDPVPLKKSLLKEHQKELKQLDLKGFQRCWKVLGWMTIIRTEVTLIWTWIWTGFIFGLVLCLSLLQCPEMTFVVKWHYIN